MRTTIKTPPPKHLADGNRKRSFSYDCRDHETINTSCLEWSGGTISDYRLVDLKTGNHVEAIRGLPWPQWEERRIDIPHGQALVRSGLFCGRKLALHFILNDSDLHYLGQ